MGDVVGVMGFFKEEKQTESKTVTTNVAEEESARPKPPPPQAPWKCRKYPEDPTQEPFKVADPDTGSGNHLGGAERKGGSQRKRPTRKKRFQRKRIRWGRGYRRKRVPKGEIPKEMARKEEIAKEEAIQTTTMIWERRQLSLIDKELARAVIILLRRHGGIMRYR